MPRRLTRATTAWDVKIIKLLHSIDDDRVKMKLFSLMEAIVGTRSALATPAVPPSQDKDSEAALRS